ncbi:ATP-grasp domain-containing protein [Candidatus Bathyarchaeota archaeon]|nr:ATP-grasp domain-containing protein [Candidatus Bathyarchaeota archaeon]
MKAALKLLVYEHISGGGHADKALPASVLSEGFSMLRTLTADFKAAGHNVTTILDTHIARFSPPIFANCIIPVISCREAQEKISKLSKQADATYIIAPETDGVLQSFVDTLEQTGVVSLNCGTSAINKVSDKAGFYLHMKKLGLSVPNTLTFIVSDDSKEIAKSVRDCLGFPAVFKPSNGVSCSGISVVRNEEQVAGAVAKIKADSREKRFLVQELVKGIAASVTVFSVGSRVVPVSLNRQDVVIETHEAFSNYNGGLVPLYHPKQAEAFEVAKKLVKSVRGLNGYVGVDFVLTEKEAVVEEVNPRLTTSYVGLRQVVNFNPAQAIINAVVKRELPTQVERCGFAYFSKVETPAPTVATLQKIYGIDEVVSPPFPISDVASALVASYGSTLQKATARFREAKKRLLDTITRSG